MDSVALPVDPDLAPLLLLLDALEDPRRDHLAGQESRIRKTASGVWSWLTQQMG